MKPRFLSKTIMLFLHGQNGNIIKAKTLNQRRMVSEAIKNNDMLFAIGPAGTEKHILQLLLQLKH